MNDTINIINISDSTEFNKLISLYNDPEINEAFGGYRPDRILNSEITFLIYLNSEPIGFILLIREKERKNSLGIDMALKKEYRSRGYGKKAMEIFKDNFLKLIQNDLHIQITKENIAANKLLNIFDNEYLESIDGSDIYKIQKK